MFRFRAGYSVARRRCFSTSPHARQPRELYRTSLEGYDRHVAVIGGGITGLTTAYRLSEDPRTHVTLYEKANRLGGWLQSEYVDVDGKKILF
ncbi:oxygen-dependent protoporphyrinogen oxidase, partial [Ascosphaera pollenicola]